MYAEAWRTIVEEEGVLRQLYAPLERALVGGEGALRKLAFVVRRKADLDTWVEQGEQLLDLRKESRFRGHGALRKEAGALLLPGWLEGSAEEVASSMEEFLRQMQPELGKARPSLESGAEKTWTQSVGDWLFSTEHISVQYGITYDGVAIEQLSPGTRGIVLLLLYLTLDQHDMRPLVIDQPEENLDPKSIFDELVPQFRSARKRRQVVMVTHNANLVVNTDADQVIVSESVQTTEGGLPTISYQSGSLENPGVRALVCQVLEGGERAFLERERRYRLRWDGIARVSE